MDDIVAGLNAPQDAADAQNVVFNLQTANTAKALVNEEKQQKQKEKVVASSVV